MSSVPIFEFELGTSSSDDQQKLTAQCRPSSAQDRTIYRVVSCLKTLLRYNLNSAAMIILHYTTNTTTKLRLSKFRQKFCGCKRYAKFKCVIADVLT